MYVFLCAHVLKSEPLGKSTSWMAKSCPHCTNLWGWWSCLPYWIFTSVPRIFAMFLHWQYQLLLICTHATLFRHRAHIRLWFYCQNKWAALRRHELTSGAALKMGFIEIWCSHQSFHTPLGFSQDQFFGNQLARCGISTSPVVWASSNKLLETTLLSMMRTCVGPSAMTI